MFEVISGMQETERVPPPIPRAPGHMRHSQKRYRFSETNVPIVRVTMLGIFLDGKLIFRKNKAESKI